MGKGEREAWRKMLGYEHEQVIIAWVVMGREGGER